ncbi:tRNA uridine-5-carboxymethylaminomethyl(34) synthesis GTPase MnmE [Agathobacter ruminis]|uniref:tRNA modification GTPase MnmE n=1 Tax=Agathobacter ruminis TaxID=1712665 RepID=A0A2G3E556_9FIRM|nr:tRNA uridine-5-carboxymethylaminomethyl(34) synthesis GTPase MnmE [Agathobacter ruminis]MDC7302314.1 tRNA uridine-5-carboxymethylaminomethyl(34) synthesis GTPase MnmE [Agathobacter ruminis]PHU38399.1 tRNA uridine-5-carboxymethylaminomethyl(34) synthesis GTPase MnmE [Agathobacter ruminis]
MNKDTICAIATAMSSSGIGIIRISGSEAIAIADKIYHSPNKDKKLQSCESHTIHYGYIYDGDQKIDEVMVLLMKAPHSYTAEDSVEIDCHGGVFVMQKILETVVKAGARLAEPGEFTKRAFLNGRIDLSQAESVMDIIDSQNQFALKSSMDQLSGKLSESIRLYRENILHEMAFIESALDDPEHFSLDDYPDELSKKMQDVIRGLQELLATADNGRILKEGIQTVILGKPNVGKSSLLNALLGYERAIVTDIAGTTRDVLQEQIHLNGLTLNLMDTAGIRKTDDIVEKIGVDKAMKEADDADLIIYVIDSSGEMDQEDHDLLSYLKDKKAIVILNKTDLEQKIQIKDVEEITNLPVIAISAKENTGIDLLEKQVHHLFIAGEITYNDQVYVTNVRHKSLIAEAISSLNLVLKSIEDQMPEDFYSVDLMNAYKQLGLIIGESVEDDLVEEIFSKFCMGK